MKNKEEVWKDPQIIQHSRILNESFKYWTGKEIFSNVEIEIELSRLMYHAPFVIVSHGTEKDPVFNYGNLKSQELWELPWHEFTRLPSRLSAEPIEEATRNKLLEEGKNRGITFLEKGIRISSQGKRFYIKDVILFNLTSEQNEYLGQGAIYHDWEFI